jgi:8-oxo-dGTP pyrophosphatase MutT (NUDIX family)
MAETAGMTATSPMPAGAQARPRALRPRDAATLVIIDRVAGRPQILMGRRRPDLVFMPDKYVFPGGRVDRGDRHVESADELAPLETAKLLCEMKGRAHAHRARGLALAALREAYEEAGILIGAPAGERQRPPPRSPAWSAFFACGLRPKLGGLRLVARAITPPGRVRRYDTRFFSIPAADITHRTAPLDAELSTLDWVTIEEARRLDLPSITRAVIEDLADLLRSGPDFAPERPVPFYFFRHGRFHRQLLTADPARQS